MELETVLKWNGDKVILLGKKVINKTAFETGLVIEGDAKLLAPVDTGRLAGSINTREEKEGVVFVGTNVEYAPYMEFGTRKADAQPFLRPALLKAKGKSLLLLEKNGKYIFGGYLET